MALSDEQLDLLKTAAVFLRNQNEVAQGLNVTFQQVIMTFPPQESPALVTFTWNGVDGYNIQIQN